MVFAIKFLKSFQEKIKGNYFFEILTIFLEYRLLSATHNNCMEASLSLGGLHMTFCNKSKLNLIFNNKAIKKCAFFMIYWDISNLKILFFITDKLFILKY